jgi:hypothetical protein
MTDLELAEELFQALDYMLDSTLRLTHDADGNECNERHKPSWGAIDRALKAVGLYNSLVGRS